MMKLEAPSGWEINKLGEVFTIRKEMWQPNGRGIVNYIGLENIESITGELVNFMPVDSSTIRSTKNKFTPNDILYGKLRPYLNKVHFPEFGGICSTDILVIIPKAIIRRKFLGYFLRSRYVLSKVSDLTYGTRMPRMKMGDLMNLSISLPPLQIQDKIIQKLDSLLTEIRPKQKKILYHQKSVELQVYNLYYRVLGQQFGSVMQLDKSVSPWNTMRLEDVCMSIQAGFAQGTKNVKDGVIHLRMNNIGTNFELNLDLVRRVSASSVQLKSFKLEEGDIIFNNTNSIGLVGKSAIFHLSELSLYSNHLTRLRPNTDIVLPEWILFFLRTLWLRGEFLRRSKKWINQAAISSQTLKDLLIPIPTLDVQRELVIQLESISSITSNIRRKFNLIVTANKRTKIQLEEIPYNIMQKAFSGKLF